MNETIEDDSIYLSLNSPLDNVKITKPDICIKETNNVKDSTDYLDLKDIYIKEQIPPFKDIKVSTKTIVSVSNIKFNIRLMYMYLPIWEYIVVKKKRGRKKSGYEQENKNKNLSPGSIISIENKTDTRGSILKTKKKSKKTYFLNSITIVLILENEKTINLKVCENGNCQMTGCKNDMHFIKTMKFVYKHIIETEKRVGQKLHTIIGDYKTPRIIFNVVMKNIDFKLGFKIKREALYEFLYKNTKNYTPHFESVIDTGVNIKIKPEHPNDEFLTCIELDKKDFSYKLKSVPYSEYLHMFGKKSSKEKLFTFLVFSSGSVIFSGSGPDIEKEYEKFYKLIKANREHYEEKLCEK